VTRKVEMPYIRRVKVQVVTKRVASSRGEVEVATKQMIETPDFEEVEEEYVEYTEKRGRRNKKTHEEKIVMEDYVTKVPVTRTRQVRKPCIRVDQVDDFEIVQVPGTKVIQVEGTRIDMVEVRNWKEETYWEIVDLKPMEGTKRRLQGEQTPVGPGGRGGAGGGEGAGGGAGGRSGGGAGGGAGGGDPYDDEPPVQTRKLGTVLYTEEDLKAAGHDEIEEDQHAGDSNAPMYGAGGVPSASASGAPSAAPAAAAGGQAAQAAPASSGGRRKNRRRANRGPASDAASV